MQQQTVDAERAFFGPRVVYLHGLVNTVRYAELEAMKRKRDMDVCAQKTATRDLLALIEKDVKVGDGAEVGRNGSENIMMLVDDMRWALDHMCVFGTEDEEHVAAAFLDEALRVATFNGGGGGGGGGGEDEISAVVSRAQRQVFSSGAAKREWARAGGYRDKERRGGRDKGAEKGMEKAPLADLHALLCKELLGMRGKDNKEEEEEEEVLYRGYSSGSVEVLYCNEEYYRDREKWGC